MVAVVVFCGAFVPVGGCAKGCGKMASHSDDLARTGASYGDDLARGGARTSDNLAVTGTRYSDDLAVTGTRYGDDLAAGGAHHTPYGGAAAELDDLSKLDLTPAQSKEVSDALDIAKDVGEEVLGQLADSDESNDDEARVRLARATKDLETRLARTLSAEQLRQFHATYGSAGDVITWLGANQGSAAAKP